MPNRVILINKLPAMAVMGFHLLSSQFIVSLRVGVGYRPVLPCFCL